MSAVVRLVEILRRWSAEKPALSITTIISSSTRFSERKRYDSLIESFSLFVLFCFCFCFVLFCFVFFFFRVFVFLTLSLQPLSASPSHPNGQHDEMLFLIIHQSFELWFKQVLHEVGAVIEIFAQAYVNETEVTELEKLFFALLVF